MAQIKSVTLLALLLGAIILACPPRAHAYLDPGTGSYLIQVILAALLGGAVALKLFWRNISGFFRRLFSRRTAPEGPSDEQ